MAWVSVMGYYLLIQNSDRKDPPEIRGVFMDYREAYTIKGRLMKSGYLVKGPFRGDDQYGR
jgi:hypothetical protein